jgi:hypothetical protein
MVGESGIDFEGRGGGSQVAKAENRLVSGSAAGELLGLLDRKQGQVHFLAVDK